ncbi:MAG: cell filamentation protein Fic [Rhodocyclales bacterium]|nr:cell filamentation protein Fic [Rhodocyclales bacterium]
MAPTFTACIAANNTSSKWAAIAKCSPDTALRDINDLLTRGVLRRTGAGGRGTCYELNDVPE